MGCTPQRVRALAFAVTLAFSAGLASAQTPLVAERFAGGFNEPVDLVAPPDDHDRLYVVERRGVIKVIEDGTVIAEPFLSIPNRINSGASERGLLGLAFHPNHQTNYFFYVCYTDSDGDTVIERFERKKNNPNEARKGTGTIILGPIMQPFDNHNGGQLHFGPDGYLYLGLGDGGSANDPRCRSQDGGTLLGKMIRIDVDGGFPYVIPPDNPFVGDPNILDEIWHFGHRNPWRWSFDRVTGDMYIGDVGQDQREEISFQFGNSLGGENYGWKIMEGSRCHQTGNCDASVPPCNDPAYTLPIHEYTHNDGCSITGGRIYRGCGIPDLDGTYFFADYCFSTIWSFKYDGNTVTEFQDRTNELNPSDGSQFNTFSCFGEDACGEIYVASLNGDVFKIVADVADSYTDLGFGKVGANGDTPEWSVCGLMSAGQTSTFSLRKGPPSQIGFIAISSQENPFNTLGGTLVPNPIEFLYTTTTDAEGEFHIDVPGGLGDFDQVMQWIIVDPGNTFDTGFSNAIRVHFQS